MSDFLCQECGARPARVRVTRTVGTRETTLHLCSQCARSDVAHLFGLPPDDLVPEFDGEQSDFDFSNEDAFDDEIAGAPLEALMNACFFADDFSVLDDDEALLEDETNLFRSLNAVPEEANARCSGCGATWPDIAREERAGCARCYSTFRASLELLLEQVQRAPRHDGKQPRAAQKRRLRLEHLRTRRDNQLALLQSRLSEAVRAERYEEAALLRDKIKVVSSSLF